MLYWVGQQHCDCCPQILSKDTTKFSLSTTAAVRKYSSWFCSDQLGRIICCVFSIETPSALSDGSQLCFSNTFFIGNGFKPVSLMMCFKSFLQVYIGPCMRSTLLAGLYHNALALHWCRYCLKLRRNTFQG